MKLTSSDARELLDRALVQFFKSEANLPQSINERTVTQQLAGYIKQEVDADEAFAGISVDCEYNRLGESETKRLKGLVNRKGEVVDPTVYPDILVHRRLDSSSNLMVIEVKTNDNKEEAAFDRRKLLEYGKQLNYQFLFFVQLDMKNHTSTIEACSSACRTGATACLTCPFIAASASTSF